MREERRGGWRTHITHLSPEHTLPNCVQGLSLSVALYTVSETHGQIPYLHTWLSGVGGVEGTV